MLQAELLEGRRTEGFVEVVDGALGAVSAHRRPAAGQHLLTVEEIVPSSVLPACHQRSRRAGIRSGWPM